MGMEKVVFGLGRVLYHSAIKKINLHQLGSEFETKAKNVNAGSADLYFIIKTSIDNTIQHLNRCNHDKPLRLVFKLAFNVLCP